MLQAHNSCIGQTTGKKATCPITDVLPFLSGVIPVGKGIPYFKSVY